MKDEIMKLIPKDVIAFDFLSPLTNNLLLSEEEIHTYTKMDNTWF